MLRMELELQVDGLFVSCLLGILGIACGGREDRFVIYLFSEKIFQKKKQYNLGVIDPIL